MDPVVRKEKFTELTNLYTDMIKAHRAGNKTTRDAKLAERKVKLAEFKHLKAANTR